MPRLGSEQDRGTDEVTCFIPLGTQGLCISGFETDDM